jgi:hypothetical protein
MATGQGIVSGLPVLSIVPLILVMIPTVAPIRWALHLARQVPREYTPRTLMPNVLGWITQVPWRLAKLRKVVVRVGVSRKSRSCSFPGLIPIFFGFGSGRTLEKAKGH